VAVFIVFAIICIGIYGVLKARQSSNPSVQETARIIMFFCAIGAAFNAGSFIIKGMVLMDPMLFLAGIACGAISVLLFIWAL
jgi:hypothetical protein